MKNVEQSNIDVADGKTPEGEVKLEIYENLAPKDGYKHSKTNRMPRTESDNERQKLIDRHNQNPYVS